MSESTSPPVKFESARRPVLPKRALVVYAVVIVAELWGYEYWQMHNDQRDTLETARNQLLTTAGSLSTHMQAMINDGVGAALAGAAEIDARGGIDRLPQTEAEATLARMLTGGDYVREVFVTTPDRFISAARQGYVDEGHAAWMTHLFDSTDDAWVGPPIQRGANDAHVVLAFASRTKRTNEWAGALFGVESLDAMYRSLPILDGTVALVSISGVLLMRAPVDARVHAVGMNITNQLAFNIVSNGWPTRTIVEAPNAITGVPRMYAVSRIEKYPLYAVAGRDIADILAPWRIRSRNSIERTVLTTAAFMVLTVMLYVVLQRRYDALRRSEERFQLAGTGTNDGIWDWDVKTNSVYYSPRLKECLGYPGNEYFAPVPETFMRRLHQEDLERVRDAVRRHLEKREPYAVEYRVRMRDGEYRWFRARAQAVWNEAGIPERMAGSVSDIHEQRLAEEQLEEARARELHAREDLARRLLRAQEQERERLANELHDSVGQNLSLIRNRALLAMQSDHLPAKAAEHVAALSDLATEVIAEVRTVAQNLRPLHIEQLGLTDALETLLDKVSESSTLKIERRLENVDDVISGEAATHLYRVAQEILNNVLKHAGATHCRVRLERDLDFVRLTIADDGVGFDTAAGKRQLGLGLASIAQRARMLSASLKIESATATDRERGTTVHLEIPVVEPMAAETAANGERHGSDAPESGTSTNHASKIHPTEIQ